MKTIGYSLLVMCLLLTLGLPAASEEREIPSWEIDRRPVPEEKTEEVREERTFHVIDRGIYGVSNAGIFAWATEGSSMWQAWRLMFSQRIPRELLHVDLSEHTIIIIALGTRPTGGYSVEVPAVYETEHALVIEYREITPKPGDMVTQALTYPYLLGVVEGQYKRVEFRSVDL